MTNLDSVLKSRDVTLLTKVCIVKAMVFKGIVLTEINPEFTVEQVQAATEATLIVSPDLKPMC